ncbi:MAG TPA: hypothetical protein VJ860_23405 [Polyangia bacterium]|jgi:hypothetical protein|nr:hypothetical protein [Polyangia bacterium]
MAYRSSRFLAFGRWQSLRWVSLLPLVLGGCSSKAPNQAPKYIGEETDFSVLVAPERAVDILFMVDNSPSMDPKQMALAANFPKMISVLQSLPGGLPDVHIGVVSSNMGAGNGAMGGNCGNGLGDRGLLWGNDPNDMTASVADGSPYATNLMASGCGLNLGQRWIEDIQNSDPNTPGRVRNYSTSLQLADVFSCLARAVGVSGCGEEHQLQATRVALIPQTGINDANNGFLRLNAYLAIVLVTDEDDCSASNSNADNDKMFDMVNKRDVGATTSLRCAARGHLCGGQPIPSYDPAVGYTDTAAFSYLFSDCSAKDQLDPSHPDHAFLPLYRVQDMIDSVNWVKGAQAKQKILVSGIVGWPPGPNDTNLPADLQTNPNYRIDKDATSLPASQANLWDYMPICAIPSQKSADGNIYKAYGGLRLKQFIDAFGDKGQVFSICNSDFTNAMIQIGNAMAQALKPGCVDYPLIDTDPTTPDITEPECQVLDHIPCNRPGQDDCLQGGFTETRLSECKDANGRILDPASLDPGRSSQAQVDAALTANISPDSRPCWFLAYDSSPATGCRNAFNQQRISVLRKPGTAAPPGTFLGMQCLTCPSADGLCPP